MLATKKGHFEIVTALLKAKANPNVTEKVCIKKIISSSFGQQL